MNIWLALNDAGNGLCLTIMPMVMASIMLTVKGRDTALLDLLTAGTGFVGEGLYLAGSTGQGQPSPIAILGVLWFGWWLWIAWRKRRKRRRLLRALGAKAKARIAAMKRKMAERPARPVLRPVPQGAARW